MGFMLLGLLLCGSVQARVLLLKSQDSSLYSSFQLGFETNLTNGGQRPQLEVMLAGGLSDADKLNSFNVIVAAGVEAAKALAGFNPSAPVVYTMLPESSYDWLRDNGMLLKRHKVLFIDQPAQRFVTLVRTALPESKSLGFIYGDVSAAQLEDLRAAAKEQQFELREIRLMADTKLINSLEKQLSDCDVALVLPDPYLFNRRTVQAILLATFRQHKPLVAYSESFVNAGALMALHSNAEQIGRQTAELLECVQGGCSENGAQEFYPRYFSLTLNPAVVRQLGLEIAPVDKLQSLLEAHAAKKMK